MGKVFLEKPDTKYGEEASPRPFKIEYISASTDWNVIKFIFTVSSSRGLLK